MSNRFLYMYVPGYVQINYGAKVRLLKDSFRSVVNLQKIVRIKAAKFRLLLASCIKANVAKTLPFNCRVFYSHLSSFPNKIDAVDRTERF
jgi:hypothetical protein